MNFGRFCESEFWMAKVAMNRMSKGNTFYGRKAHITSCVDYLSESLSRDFMFDLLTQRRHFFCSQTTAAGLTAGKDIGKELRSNWRRGHRNLGRQRRRQDACCTEMLPQHGCVLLCIYIL